jgi:beta-phosphoglucomutase-like phosphatase (HAD superfamily)
MTFTLYAFDLDGTLADTESQSIPSMVAFLTEYGIHLTREEWLTTYHGMSGQPLLDKLNAAYGTTMVWAEFYPRRYAHISKLFREKGVEPAPGMLQMVRRLAAAGQQLCIVSNSSPERIALTLEVIKGQRAAGVMLPALFEGHIISAIDPATPNRRAKPTPDAYLAAAAHYRATPASCLAVEDSAAGVTSGVEAGFTVWGYVGLAHNPTEAAEKLRAAGAHHILTHWDELSG